jgi:hypothetical protein
VLTTIANLIAFMAYPLEPVWKFIFGRSGWVENSLAELKK